MRQFATRKLISVLKKKGFQQVEGDHHFFIFFVDGKETRIRTKISHGTKKIYDSKLLSIVRKQLFLENQDFENLLNCPLSQEGYSKILKQKQLI